jgi:hypothetical protein
VGRTGCCRQREDVLEERKLAHCSYATLSVLVVETASNIPGSKEAHLLKVARIIKALKNSLFIILCFYAGTT